MFKISYKITIAIIFCSILMSGTIALFSISKSKYFISKEAKYRLINLIKFYAKDFETKLEETVVLAKSIGNITSEYIDIDKLKNKQKEIDEFEERILPAIKSNIKASSNKSGWIVFNSKEGLGANSVSLTQGLNNSFKRANQYDANNLKKDENDWWFIPMEKGEYWTPPYHWKDTKTGEITNYISYGQRVEKDGKILGISGSDFIFDELKNKISGLKIYKTGYLVLLDSNYNFLYHPDKEFKNLKTSKNGKFYELANEIENSVSKEGYYEYKLEGKKKIFVYVKLNNGWILGGAVQREEIYSGVKQMSKILIYILIIGIILGGFVSVMLGNKITKPILDFVEIFETGSKGDLRVRMEIKTNDETKKLSETFNVFVKKIENVMSSIKEGAIIINKYSDEINKANNNLAEKTASQAASLEETSATMEEISSLIISNSKVSLEASIMTKLTKTNAEKVGNLSEELRISMEKISKSSKEISNIIEVIDEIAFQTNLLALNAAVEAARAGEQGRGFAVVAQEVRNLAGRSGKAAKEIKELIRDSGKKVQEGQNSVEITIKSIKGIVEDIKKVNDVIETIALSADEESKGVEQINKAIIDLDNVTQMNTGIAEETSVSASILNQKANDFMKLINFFKIKDI